MSFYTENKKYIIKLLSILFFLIFVYVFMKRWVSYVSPFIFGYLVSLLIVPVIDFLNNKLNINKKVSIMISIFLLIFTIGIVGALIIIQIIKEGTAFLENLPNLIKSVDNVISILKLKFNKINLVIPLELQESANTLKDTLILSVTKMVGSTLKSFSTKLVSTVPKAVIGFLLGLLSSYFFAKDRAIILKFFSKLVPTGSKNNLKMLRKNTISSITGYFKAQFIIMSTIASICIIGLSILKVSYSIFLGVLIAIVDALPIFGSGLFYWPWITYSFITKDYYNTIGLSIIYTLVFLTRYIMEPKIIGKQIGIHPLAALMSIYIGLNVFGFLGIILGPCIAVVIKSILEF